MKKYLKENAFALYLGASLSFVGIGLFMWEFWVVIVPTIILLQIRD